MRSKSTSSPVIRARPCMARTLSQAAGIEVPVRMSWNSVKRRSSQAASSRGEAGVALARRRRRAATRRSAWIEQLLAVALGGLDVVHHAVAAGEAVLQLGRDARQAVALVGDGVEEGLRGARRLSSWPSKPRVGEDPLDHRLRRAAAVVADAVEAHGVAERRVGGLDGERDLAAEVGEVGDVAGDDAEGDDLAAAGALPDGRCWRAARPGAAPGRRKT